MGDLRGLIWCAMAGLFRSRAALQAEILVLRHQLNVLRRKSPKRVAVGDIDRLLFCGLYRLSPKVLDALKIFQPETLIRWHRAGFRAYWRWRSGPRGGRPKTPADVRQLILEMSVANPLWGAPRIHGEPLELGIDVGQTTVAKYMAKRRRPTSQGWKTFLRNHADGIASIDMFVVPTISFRQLYGLLVLRHSRRELLWLGVTAHPSAEWIARQLTEACGWSEPPRYIIRDRDGAYGDHFVRRLTAMGILDRHFADPSVPGRLGSRGFAIRSGGAATFWRGALRPSSPMSTLGMWQSSRKRRCSILPENFTWCASTIPPPKRISTTPACPVGNPRRRERRASARVSSISRSTARAVPSPISSRRPPPPNIPIVPSL
jgi:hypothetical protein